MEDKNASYTYTIKSVAANANWSGAVGVSGELITTTSGTSDNTFYYPSPGWAGNLTVPAIQVMPAYPLSGGLSMWPPKPKWPEDLLNTIGLLHVEDGKVYLRTEGGEDVLLAEMGDDEEEVRISLVAVIARRMLEKSVEDADAAVR